MTTRIARDLHARGGPPAWDELKTQAACAEDCGECRCGCGTVNLEGKEPRTRAAAREPIPVEGCREFLDLRPAAYTLPEELKPGGFGHRKGPMEERRGRSELG
jgi:hypothetical protein